MFRIIIDGKSPEDLRANVETYLKAFGNQTKEESAGQIPFSAPAMTPTLPLTQKVIEQEAAALFNSPVPFDNLITPAVNALAQEIAQNPPAAPQEIATAYGVGKELDSAGLPWDRRIHSETRVKTKTGEWRYRRNIEQALKDQVEAELRGKMSAAAPAIHIPTFPPTSINPVTDLYAMQTAPIATTPMQQNAPSVQESAPFANSPPQPNMGPLVASEPFIPTFPPSQTYQPPVQQPAAPSRAPASIATQTDAHTLQTFRQNLVATLGKLINDRKIDQDYINKLKAHYGVDQIWNLNDQQSENLFEAFVQGRLITKVG